MDVRNGFIVGIFNYCDRWCEVCAFTSRCRTFAKVAEIEAQLDPAMRAVVGATARGDRHEPPQWLEDTIAEAEAAVACAGVDGFDERPSAPEHQPLEARAVDYAHAVDTWLRARGDWNRRDPRDPVSVISWFAVLIPGKIVRAAVGAANDDGEADGPADHDGSAKVALLGIERSHAAWRALVSTGRVSDAEASPFFSQLTWLGAALERAFPRARAFVRPGFDEPDAVARFEAAGR